MGVNHVRMDDCEKRIKQEVEDRIKYHDDHLNPIRGQLKGIQDGLDEREKLKEEIRVKEEKEAALKEKKATEEAMKEKKETLKLKKS